MSIRFQAPDPSNFQDLQAQAIELQRQLSGQTISEAHLQQIQDLLTQAAKQIQQSPQATNLLPELEKTVERIRQGIQYQDNGLLIEALELLQHSCNPKHIRD